MDSNESQSLPTLDNQIIDLNNEGNLPTMDQQITINDTNEKLEQKTEDSSNNAPIPETVEPEQEKNETAEKPQETEEKKENENKSYIDKLLCIFSFIRPYFKVTFNDVKLRIISSFLPINNSFFDIAVQRPDLYGPFWIYTTLIYVIAAGGALSYYFTNSVNNYFQAFVPVAGSILYCFGFGFPLVMYLCMRFFKVEMKYVSLICLYGYSLTCFIPVLILCASGFAWIQWILLLYGIANSTVFVLINIWNTIRILEARASASIFRARSNSSASELFSAMALYPSSRLSMFSRHLYTFSMKAKSVGAKKILVFPFTVNSFTPVSKLMSAMFSSP